MVNQVRTRIAPSPTGLLHIGSLYIALKNFAYARGREGQFVIRIEDTDRERLVPGVVEQTLVTLKNYGLNWDEGPDVDGPYGPYVQSERLDIYRKHALSLVEKGNAYHCFCTKVRLDEMRKNQLEAKQLPRYDRLCRGLSVSEVEEKLHAGEANVIRLKVPDGQTVEVEDLIRGTIKFQTDLMDDQVLLKSDGYPTYHLGVVVDDHLMNISHVIRGEEWISSTPKHVLLYEAFDWPLPVYAHAPDLLSPTGKGKMSKRQGDVSAQSFLDKGYLPEAMLNFLMILGWASSDQEEILDMDRYIREFDVKDISKKSVAFDTNKLDYLNGVYIRRMSDAELTDALRPFKAPELTEDLFREFIPLIKERLVKLSDFSELSVYLCRAPEIFGERLIKESKMDATQTAEFLRQVIDVVGKSAWNTGELEAELRGLQQQLKMKPRPAFMTLRLAVTGQQATPPLFEVMVILGKDEVVKRLTQALSVL